MQKEIFEIVTWCNSHKILLIEDSSCAINSKIHNQYLGTFGDYGVWSLDSMKLISAGDGGIIYSKSIESAKLLRERMYLGLKNKTSGLSGAMTKQKWWEYDISGPYRRSIMNDVTASIALVQLSKISELVKKRNSIINYYAENLHAIGDLQFDGITGDFRSPYFFWLQTKSRNELAQHLLDQEIYTTFRYFPLHKIDYFKSKVSLNNSDVASETSLLLPLHANLTESQIEKIIKNISIFFKTKK
jgi:aminotransferase